MERPTFRLSWVRAFASSWRTAPTLPDDVMVESKSNPLVIRITSMRFVHRRRLSRVTRQLGNIKDEWDEASRLITRAVDFLDGTPDLDVISGLMGPSWGYGNVAANGDIVIRVKNLRPYVERAKCKRVRGTKRLPNVDYGEDLAPDVFVEQETKPQTSAPTLEPISPEPVAAEPITAEQVAPEPVIDVQATTPEPTPEEETSLPASYTTYEDLIQAIANVNDVRVRMQLPVDLVVTDGVLGPCLIVDKLNAAGYNVRIIE